MFFQVADGHGGTHEIIYFCVLTMSRYLIIYFLSVFSFSNCYGTVSGAADTSELGKLISAGFADIYNFKFKQADSLANELKKKYPGDKRIYLLIANSYWWKIHSGDDNAENRKQFIAALNSAGSILALHAKNELPDEDLFYYINIYSYMARLELLDDHYFKAFSFLNKCDQYLFTSFGKEPVYEPFNLTTGLYNYSVVAARKKYPLLIPFLAMLPAADKSAGIKMLVRCSGSSDRLLQTEGDYFLMLIYGEGDIDFPLSEKYAEKLCSQYPDNLLYRYYFFKTLLQDEKKSLAMKQYFFLFQSETQNGQLTPEQKKYFISLAQKDLETYYGKHPSSE